MNSRRDWSNSDLQRIWINYANDSTRAKCPYNNCLLPNKMMNYNDYGDYRDDSWVVDHIKPISKGGTDSFDNLQPMHNLCNNRKSDRW